MYEIRIIDKLFTKYDKENGASTESNLVDINMFSSHYGDSITKEDISNRISSMLGIDLLTSDLRVLDDLFMFSVFEDANSNQVMDIESFEGQLYIVDYSVQVYKFGPVSPSTIN